jgi:hypothetical protein
MLHGHDYCDQSGTCNPGPSTPCAAGCNGDLCAIPGSIGSLCSSSSQCDSKSCSVSGGGTCQPTCGVNINDPCCVEGCSTPGTVCSVNRCVSCGGFQELCCPTISQCNDNGAACLNGYCYGGGA